MNETKITKKRIDFRGAWTCSVCAMILDLEEKDLHFYVSEGEGMIEVDYQIFISEFHSQAHMCIAKDDLRENYLRFQRAIDEYIDEYCGMVGCE